jgi:serine/threonine protein kinase
MIGKNISHYRILEKLGEGGMGIVYKAEDLTLKRTVALKFLPPELTKNAKARKRFIQEAQAASALDHPDICVIHEIDETKPAPADAGDGQIFIYLAYYDGETLKEKIKRGLIKIEEVIDYEHFMNICNN